MAPRFQFGGLTVLIIGGNALAGIYSKPSGLAAALPACAFARTAILVVVCFVIIGQLPPVFDPRGVLIDQRGRISLSRLQLVMWSVLVISAILTEGFSTSPGALLRRSI